jgi:hypothetical protein
MNATKDELKSAPGFSYDKDSTTWVPDVAPPSILLAGVLPDALPPSKLRPGLLSRAKINVPQNPDVGSYLRQQIADDLLYTTNWSLSLDVSIILRILTSKTSYKFN